MKLQHQDLINSGRWAKMSFCEQMANIGSEVSRALNWRKKDKPDLSEKAILRALELLWFTIELARKYPARLKELCRVREVLIDYFFCDNEYGSSEILWRKYFDYFVLVK